MQARITSLDALRGFTLAAMILVNTPGSWSYVYSPLLHAPWHGITPTDFVFPLFLFVVGASIGFALKTAIRQRQLPWPRLIKRTLGLIFVGVLLNALPFDQSWQQLRLPGVLQRIGLCYLMASIMIILLPSRLLLVSCAVLLLGYWGVLAQFPYTLEHNPVGYLDQLILGADHLWQGKSVAFDPEGLLSTLPAVVSTISGYFAARVILTPVTNPDKIRTLLVYALVLTAAGLLWALTFPLNKYLWSSSFVLVTSGVAFALLALLMSGEVYLGRTFVTGQIYGSNPLLIYVLSSVWAIGFSLPVINLSHNHSISAGQWLFNQLQPLMGPYMASLTFALFSVLVFYALSHLLYHKRIFIRL